MQAISPFRTLAAILIGVLLAAWTVCNLDRVRRFLTRPDGPEVEVLRAELCAQAEDAAAKMDRALADANRLSRRIKSLERRLASVLKDPAIKETEYPALWEKAREPVGDSLKKVAGEGAKPSGKRFWAAFYSLRNQLAKVPEDLDNGGNPYDWKPLVERADKLAEGVADQVRERKEALQQLLEAFAQGKHN